eukprot:6472388-Amphidinium_carterae.1
MRKACLEFASQHTIPLTEEEYKAELAEEKTRSRHDQRLVAPRVGPQYIGEGGRPMARVVQTADAKEVFAGVVDFTVHDTANPSGSSGVT